MGTESVTVVIESSSSWPTVWAGVIAAISVIIVSTLTGLITYKVTSRTVRSNIAESRRERSYHILRDSLIPAKSTASEAVRAWEKVLNTFNAYAETGAVAEFRPAFEQTTNGLGVALDNLYVAIGRLGEVEVRDAGVQILNVIQTGGHDLKARLPDFIDPDEPDLDEIREWVLIQWEAVERIRPRQVEFNKLIDGILAG